VRRALLLELIATFRVVACKNNVLLRLHNYAGMHAEFPHLKQNKQTVQKHVYGSKEEVSHQSKVLSLSTPRLCRRPQERVNSILAKGRKQTVAHLEHVVEDVQLDNGLRLDQVVHHGCVNIAHGEAAHKQNNSLKCNKN